MRGKDTRRNALPIGCDEERALHDARRYVDRPAHTGRAQPHQGVTHDSRAVQRGQRRAPQSCTGSLERSACPSQGIGGIVTIHVFDIAAVKSAEITDDILTLV